MTAAIIIIIIMFLKNEENIYLNYLASKLHFISTHPSTHGLLYLHGPTLRILKEKIVGQIFQF